MTDNPSDAIWPLPKFFFQVKMAGQTMSFQEVSGLDVESQAIEYRSGNSKMFSSVKMPGLQKSANVTLKKGVFANDNTIWDWFKQIKMNTIKRETVTIELLDQTGAPTMVWTLQNAWPVKITGTDLKADGNEVAVDSIELVFETLTIENG
jgi:phage tail-like protein